MKKHDFLKKKRKTVPSKAKPILRQSDSRTSAIELIISKYPEIKNFKGLYIEKFLSDGMLLTHIYPKKCVLVSDNPFIKEFYTDINYKTAFDIKMLDRFFYKDGIETDRKNKVFENLIKYLNYELRHKDIGITNWYELSRAAIFYSICRMASSSYSIKYTDNSLSEIKMSSSVKRIINVIDDDFKIDYFNGVNGEEIRVVSSEVETVPAKDDFMFVNLPKKYDSNDALEFASEFMECDNGVFLMEDTSSNRQIFEKFKIISKKQFYNPDNIETSPKNVIAVIKHKGKIYD